MIKQYFKENKLHPQQPVIALIVLLLTILFGFYVSTRVAALPVWLIAGLAIGYAFTRSRFGFAGGIKKLYYAGNAQLAIAILLLLGVTAFLTTGIQWSAAANGAVPAYAATAKQAVIPGSASVEFANIGTLIGGALFGIGMTLAGGCASGTLTDFGEGEGHAIVALPFFILGSPIGVFLSSKLDGSSIGKIGGDVYLPDHFGYIGSFIFLIVFLFVLYGIIRFYQAKRKQAGKQNAAAEVYEAYEKPLAADPSALTLYHKLFIERWSFATTALVTTVIAGFIIITTGKAWGVTSAFTLQGFQFFNFLGIHFTGSEFDALNQQLAAGGFLSDGSSIRNIGIVVGSLVAFLLAGRFTLNFHFSFKDSLTYALGGIFMGVGARLAKGCNIGALYSGITNYSLHGYLFLIFLVAGSVATLIVLEGKFVLFPRREQKQAASTAHI